MTWRHCFWTSVLPIVPASQPAYWRLESWMVFCVSTYTGFPFLTVTTTFPKPTVRIWKMIFFSSSVSSSVFSVMFFTSSQQNIKKQAATTQACIKNPCSIGARTLLLYEASGVGRFLYKTQDILTYPQKCGFTVTHSRGFSPHSSPPFPAEPCISYSILKNHSTPI